MHIHVFTHMLYLSIYLSVYLPTYQSIHIFYRHMHIREPQVQARLEAEGWDTDANPVTAQRREPAVPAGDAGRGRGGRGGAGAGTAPGVASMVFLCVARVGCMAVCICICVCIYLCIHVCIYLSVLQPRTRLEGMR